MSLAAWIMLGAHIILLMIFRIFINRKKKILQKENSLLITENQQLKGEVAYYERELRNR